MSKHVYVYVHMCVHVWAFPSAGNNSKSSEHHYWWSQPGNPGNHLAWLEVKKLCLLSTSRAKPAHWDARDCWAGLGAGVKPQLPSVGQGGLSSALLGHHSFGITKHSHKDLILLVLWGRRLLIDPWNLIHQINNKVILNALKLPRNFLESLWGSSMSSQEQDAFQVSSSGPLKRTYPKGWCSDSYDWDSWEK